MYQKTALVLAGIIIGSLLSTPAVAQTAQRMWAITSTQLAAGATTGTPLLCTASGDGCVLTVVAVTP